jgi:hypothetical protein
VFVGITGMAAGIYSIAAGTGTFCLIGGDCPYWIVLYHE